MVSCRDGWQDINRLHHEHVSCTDLRTYRAPSVLDTPRCTHDTLRKVPRPADEASPVAFTAAIVRQMCGRAVRAHEHMHAVSGGIAAEDATSED